MMHLTCNSPGEPTDLFSTQKPWRERVPAQLKPSWWLAYLCLSSALWSSCSPEGCPPPATARLADWALTQWPWALSAWPPTVRQQHVPRSSSTCNEHPCDGSPFQNVSLSEQFWGTHFQYLSEHFKSSSSKVSVHSHLKTSLRACLQYSVSLCPKPYSPHNSEAQPFLPLSSYKWRRHNIAFLSEAHRSIVVHGTRLEKGISWAYVESKLVGRPALPS